MILSEIMAVLKEWQLEAALDPPEPGEGRVLDGNIFFWKKDRWICVGRTEGTASEQ